MRPGRIVALLLVLFPCYSYAFAAADLLTTESANYYRDGVKAQKGNNFIEAEEAYQKALLVDPNNLTLLKYVDNNRGAMLGKQGDYEKAKVYLNEALVIDPDYKPPQINLGFIYEKEKTRLESLEYWSKVFELDKLKPRDYLIEEGPKQEKKR